MNQIVYKALPTPAKFHRSDAFYRGIRGPRGSGKSTAMVFEGMRRSQQQEPAPDGIRRSRGVVVRNTYRELIDTSLKTWLWWFKEDYFGKFNYQNMTHNIKINDCEIEVLFRALDRPKDVKKILSLEVTWAWINEAKEIYTKEIIDGLGECVGRYPPKSEGGPTWWGVFMDTNAPDDDHWWYRLAEEIKPDGWKFWNQPGGLLKDGDRFIPNPAAENIQNLPGGYNYYLNGIEGKTRDHILVYYCNHYGFVKEGKAVHPEYNDALHCSQEDLKPISGLPIWVGLDFGLTPAAVFGQKMPNGRWIWFDELVTEDMGVSRFADLLGPKLRGEYRDFEFEIYGDPSGDIRTETDERTVFQILEAKGIPAKPAPSNDVVLRREAVSVPFTRIIDGKPGLIISPKCKMVRKGLAGGFCYKRIQVSGEERYHDKPDKNKYSHPCEAGEYMMLGAGEGQLLITVPKKKQDREFKPISIAPSPQGWMAD